MIAGRDRVYEREQLVPFALDEVFDLFSDARSLELITPRWLRFGIVGTPPAIEAGALIRYRLSFRGVPIRWTSRIAVWEPPRRFVDVQVRGPYSLWEHTHSFEAVGGATRIGDRVVYRQPLGPLGDLAERLFARRDIERIFDFRESAVLTLLELRNASKPHSRDDEPGVALEARA